jgi:hypothetical protein
MPPRGLGHSSCNGDIPPRPDITGTWLELVTAPPSQVWTDRAREISKLREQGETLANIGHRFGLSAERVRQILLQEDQAPPNLVGAEQAFDDNSFTLMGAPIYLAPARSTRLSASLSERAGFFPSCVSGDVWPAQSPIDITLPPRCE